MTQINKVPNGLLSALGLKQQGRNPTQLSDVVIGTMDLATAYLAYDLRLYDDLQTFNGTGMISQVTIPTGEIWFPVHMSCEASVPGANDTAAISLRVASLADDGLGNGLTNRVVLAWGPGIPDPWTFTGSLNATFYSWPFLVGYPSDTRFEWYCAAEQIGATPANGSCQLAYYRLEV